MVIIGSRGSDLALWQARYVQALLHDRAGLATEIRIIKTEGDRDQDSSLGALPGKGFFTKEIEAALLDGGIDLAVHSHKDLPTESPAGLSIAAVPERASARECLLIAPEAHDAAAPGFPLREGTVIATGSARRRYQLLARRPDLDCEDLRGNVPTRIGKLAGTHPTARPLGAIVLAEAALLRLEIDPAPLIAHLMPPEDFVPAPAQGALALQTRIADAGGDGLLASALASVHDTEVARCVEAERLVLAGLEGGCSLPLGAYAENQEAGLKLVAVFGGSEGSLRRSEIEGNDPAAVAAQVLEELRA